MSDTECTGCEGRGGDLCSPRLRVSASPRRLWSAVRRGLERIVLFGRMVKFGHSVFALPFALSAVVLAARWGPVTAGKVAWILVAMVGARSAAMGFNRTVDAEIDARNPRTAGRELPTGRISKRETMFFVAGGALALVVAAWRLHRLCLIFSPFALAIPFFYSFAKRLTWSSHFILGLSLGIAPMGAWIAISGGFSPKVLPLVLAVLLWVAGFDILYACLDYAFDVEQALHSIPQRFGIRRAFRIARMLHVASFLSMVWLGWIFRLGWVYSIGLLLVGLALIYEHRLVHPEDLSRMDRAFFTTNGFISVAYFVFLSVDVGW